MSQLWLKIVLLYFEQWQNPLILWRKVWEFFWCMTSHCAAKITLVQAENHFFQVFFTIFWISDQPRTAPWNTTEVQMIAVCIHCANKWMNSLWTKEGGTEWPPLSLSKYHYCPTRIVPWNAINLQFTSVSTFASLWTLGMRVQGTRVNQVAFYLRPRRSICWLCFVIVIECTFWSAVEILISCDKCDHN